MRLEPLEDRWTPATLNYNAPPGVDHLLELRLNASRLELRDNGVLQLDPELSTLTGVFLSGADKNDTLSLNLGGGFFTLPINFNGGFGAGTDRIEVAADLSYVLTNFSLSITTLGSQVFLSGMEEASLSGGAGNNTIDATAFSGRTTLDGGNGNDVLRASQGGSTLRGGFGDDFLRDGAGLDQLQAGDGHDTIVSTSGGNDQIQGGLGNDLFQVNAGSEIIIVDDGGDDTVDTTPIPGGGVQITLAALTGQIIENSNPTSIITIATGTTIETVIGTNGPDVFVATNVTDRNIQQTFIGRGGNDVFRDETTALVTTFIGGAPLGSGLSGGGDDKYVINPGSEVIIIDDGGNDTIDTSPIDRGPVNVTLQELTATVFLIGSPTDRATITGTIENVIGTRFDDVIVGNSQPNVLDGGPGSDTLDGGAGKDVMMIAPGSTETVFDSAGVDTLDFSNAVRGISINLTSNGNQKIDSAGNRIRLVGTFENVIGTPFDDVINGNQAANVLIGGDGDDRLNGHQGRDVLIGGYGSDRLVAGPDDDLLIGGWTVFDGDSLALQTIQDEWTSPRSYDERIANLRGPGTVDRLNGDNYLKASGSDQTVFDDGVEDVLTGSAGLDWFFLFAGDVATDGHGDEETN